jgi:hypothetical protein
MLNQAVVAFLESKAKVDASGQGLLAVKRYPSYSVLAKYLFE